MTTGQLDSLIKQLVSATTGDEAAACAGDVLRALDEMPSVRVALMQAVLAGAWSAGATADVAGPARDKAIDALIEGA